MEQISIFDGANPLRIDKPIRLVELFGGYGSQALALKYLGIPFEHHALSEWAVKSIQAYKDMHSADDNSDYSETLSADEIRGWLLGRISADYSTPMTEKQIARLTDNAVRQIFNNMKCCSALKIKEYKVKRGRRQTAGHCQTP